jgi:hypothetical protein
MPAVEMSAFCLVLTILGSLAAAVILFSVICRVNLMTPGTPGIQRLAYVMMGVGAASLLLSPWFFDYRPTVSSTVLECGIAVLMVADQLHGRKIRQRYGTDRRASSKHRWWIED